MSFKVLVISLLAYSTLVMAEVSFKKDLCTAEADKLLGEFQLGTLNEPNKAKFNETTCAEITSEVAAVKTAAEKVKKMALCPAGTSDVGNYSCMTKEESEKSESMREVLERLESVELTPELKVEKEKLVAENNKLFAKGAARIPSDKKEMAIKVRGELTAAIVALDNKLGRKPNEKSWSLSGEHKALIEGNITSVCKTHKKVDKHLSGSQALANFENQQADFIRDYEAALNYEKAIKDKDVPEEMKRQAYIPELKKLEASVKHYRENLMAAHNLLKKMALEEGAIDKMNLGSKVFVKDGKVKAVVLENGNGIMMSDNCQLEMYSWFGLDVDNDCMSNISKEKDRNYGEICRKHFQFTNAKGYVKPASAKTNSRQ